MIHFRRSRTNGSRTKVVRVCYVGALVLGGVTAQAQAVPQPVPQAGVTTGAGAPVPVSVRNGVEPIVSMRDAPAGVGTTTLPGHKKSYDLTIAAGDWVDTGVVLAAGEEASFAATGQVTVGDGRETGAAGLDRGWKDLLRQFPLNRAKVGALIGRVSDMGASVPFEIGESGTVTIPTSGKLYLRANLSTDLSGDGSFKVKLTFPDKPKTASVSAAFPTTAKVSDLVSPATFAEIPRRVEDEAQSPGDMVNYALLGTEAQVKAAFSAAGWVPVDKSVGDAVLHGLLSTLSHEAYTEVPMSTLYLFGRPQDLSFARGDPLTVAAERHHLRVWKTDQTVGGELMWVGSATHDVGFERDQRNGKATHKIDPEIDSERKFLLDSFDAAGAFESAAYVTPPDPLVKARTATGGSFFSDGRILVMGLK